MVIINRFVFLCIQQFNLPNVKSYRKVSVYDLKSVVNNNVGISLYVCGFLRMTVWEQAMVFASVTVTHKTLEISVLL